MNQIIGTIQGQDIHRIISNGYETVLFMGDADIDCDGTGGNPQHDPYFQPDTKLHFQGKPLCAEQVPYVVVPPCVVKRTRGVVFGSLCEVEWKGRSVQAVVGDLGPTRKIGEVSVRLAELLGMNPSPINGGVDSQTVRYKIHVGVPAIVDGVHYQLQPA